MCQEKRGAILWVVRGSPLAALRSLKCFQFRLGVSQLFS
jgi:hypothetical protein